MAEDPVMPGNMHERLRKVEHDIRDIEQRLSEIYKEGASISLSNLKVMKKVMETTEKDHAHIEELRKAIDAIRKGIEKTKADIQKNVSIHLSESLNYNKDMVKHSLADFYRQISIIEKRINELASNNQELRKKVDQILPPQVAKRFAVMQAAIENMKEQLEDFRNLGTIQAERFAKSAQVIAYRNEMKEEVERLRFNISRLERVFNNSVEHVKLIAENIKKIVGKEMQTSAERYDNSVENIERYKKDISQKMNSLAENMADIEGKIEALQRFARNINIDEMKEDVSYYRNEVQQYLKYDKRMREKIEDIEKRIRHLTSMMQDIDRGEHKITVMERKICEMERVVNSIRSALERIEKTNVSSSDGLMKSIDILDQKAVVLAKEIRKIDALEADLNEIKRREKEKNENDINIIGEIKDKLAAQSEHIALFDKSINEINAMLDTNEYDKIKAEISDIGRLKDEQDKLKAEIVNINRLRDEQEKLKAEIVNIKQLKDEQDKLKAEIVNINRFRDEQDKLKAEMINISRLRDEQDELKAEIANIDQLRDEQDKLKAEIANIGRIRDEQEKLKVEIANIGRIRDEQEKLKVEIANIDQLRDEQDKLKAEIANINRLKDEQDKLKAEIADIAQLNQRNFASIKNEIEQRIGAIKKQVEEFSASIKSHAETSRHEMNIIKNMIKDEIATIRNNIAEIKEAEEKRMHVTPDMLEQISYIKNRLSILERSLGVFENALREVREIKAVHEDKIAQMVMKVDMLEKEISASKDGMNALFEQIKQKDYLKSLIDINEINASIEGLREQIEAVRLGPHKKIEGLEMKIASLGNIAERIDVIEKRVSGLQTWLHAYVTGLSQASRPMVLE